VRQQAARTWAGCIGVAVTRRFSFLMVVAAKPGSPAEKAGLRTGDIVKSIDGRHSRPLLPPVGQRLLRGAPGSVVKLSILRAGADPFEVSVVRERIGAAAPSSKVRETGRGYVKVPEFSSKGADEVRAEVESLKKNGARNIVLDLRDSAFGSPAEGVKVAEIFLKGGPVAKLGGTRVPE